MSRRKAQNAQGAPSLESVDGDSCVATQQREVEYAPPSSSSGDRSENVGSAQNALRE